MKLTMPEGVELTEALAASIGRKQAENRGTLIEVLSALVKIEPPADDSHLAAATIGWLDGLDQLDEILAWHRSLTTHPSHRPDGGRPTLRALPGGKT